MAETKDSLSRRGFLKGIGTGVLGATIAPKVRFPEAPAPAAWDGKLPVVLRVNGKEHRLLLEPRTTLVRALRDHLGLTGTKLGCDRGECGCCTVLMDNKPVYSCQILAVEAQDHEITTIEGLVQGEELDPLQKAFVEHDAMQCGFCTPGQVMAAKGLLLKNPNPTREEIVRGMSGNLCRCAAYPGILRAVEAVVRQRRG
ncbi:MAG: (2Fe-2S)-binding protein [candidate division KSB1 bacterium]|nr:(2Fe-2S)-binding protein [candidate division KSB1 bacterium]